jgi:hypothetical protein
MFSTLTGPSLTENRAYDVRLERKTVIDHPLDDILLSVMFIAMLFCIRRAIDDRSDRSFEEQMLSASTEARANRLA